MCMQSCLSFCLFGKHDIGTLTAMLFQCRLPSHKKLTVLRCWMLDQMLDGVHVRSTTAHSAAYRYSTCQSDLAAIL